MWIIVKCVNNGEDLRIMGRKGVDNRSLVTGGRTVAKGRGGGASDRDFKMWREERKDLRGKKR